MGQGILIYCDLMCPCTKRQIVDNVRLNVQLLAQLVSFNNQHCSATHNPQRCRQPPKSEKLHKSKCMRLFRYITSRFHCKLVFLFQSALLISSIIMWDKMVQEQIFWHGCRSANHSKQFTDGLQIRQSVGELRFRDLGNRLISLINEPLILSQI